MAKEWYHNGMYGHLALIGSRAENDWILEYLGLDFMVNYLWTSRNTR